MPGRREGPEARFTERRRLPRALDAAVLVFAAACVLSIPFLVRYAETQDVASWIGLPVFLGVVPVLIGAIHSRVVVTGAHLSLALVPLWRKRLPLEEIAEVRQRTIRAREMGGLGLRRTLDGATALVLRGTGAVEVTTRQGKRYVVGTDRPGDLARALGDRAQVPRRRS